MYSGRDITKKLPVYHYYSAAGLWLILLIPPALSPLLNKNI